MVEEELEPLNIAPKLRLVWVFAHMDALLPPPQAPGQFVDHHHPRPQPPQLFPGEPELHYELVFDDNDDHDHDGSGGGNQGRGPAHGRSKPKQQRERGPLRWLEGRRIVVTLARPPSIFTTTTTAATARDSTRSSTSTSASTGSLGSGDGQRRRQRRPQITSITFRQLGEVR